jgi:hypothetical protein
LGGADGDGTKNLEQEQTEAQRKSFGVNGHWELVIENLSSVIGARKGGRKERETGSVVHKMRGKKKIVLIV